MSRRFRISMGKGGRGSLRPSYRRPKLNLISRFVLTFVRCSQKLTQTSGPRGLKLNQPGLQVYESRLILFRTTQTKIGGVSLICNTSYFCNTIDLARDLTLIRYNFETEARSPNQLYFLNPECIKIPWVLAPKFFPGENFWVRSLYNGGSVWSSLGGVLSLFLGISFAMFFEVISLS